MLFVAIVVVLMVMIVRFDNEVRQQNMSEIGDKLSHVITSYSIHYTKLYDICWQPVPPSDRFVKVQARPLS